MALLFSFCGRVKIQSSNTLPLFTPNIKCPVFWFLKNGIPVLFAYIEGMSVFDALFALF
jgi:hypothetical protein